MNISIETADNTQYLGLQIADFIAGIAPFIKTYNKSLCIRTQTAEH